MKNNSHIRKAVFVFNLNKEFLPRFDGLILAAKNLNISQSTIKKHAENNIPYKNYIFSYTRIL